MKQNALETILSFDRGTLVFKNTEQSSSEIEQLNSVLWDPRVNVYRAPAILYQSLIEELQTKQINFIDQVKPSLSVSNSSVSNSLPTTWLKFDLRPYQETAIDSLSLANWRGILSLPTGSGKTLVAIGAMKKLNVNTICLVPTRVLLEQWVKQIKVYYTGKVGVLGDGKYNIQNITVATFESAYRYMSRIGNLFEFLIVDEVHHFGSNMRDEALEMSIAPYRLGLTATLPNDQVKLGNLHRFIGPLLYQINVSDLAGNYLANFEICYLNLPLTPSERAIYDTNMKIFRIFFAWFRIYYPDGDWPLLVKIAYRQNEGRKALAALRYCQKLVRLTKRKKSVLSSLLRQHFGQKILIFTTDTASVYSISRLFLIQPITADIKKKERVEIINRFREGNIKVLVSCQVLNEGFDVPEAEIGIIVGGKLGSREYIQRIGRLLRPAIGKKAIIYELVADNTVETRQAQKRRKAIAS